MKTAHVIFIDGSYNYTTCINVTDEDIRNYFIGAKLQMGDTDDKPFDDIQTPINCIVEELD